MALQVAPPSGTLCGLLCGTRQVLGGTAARPTASGEAALSHTWPRSVGFRGSGGGHRSSSNSGARLTRLLDAVDAWQGGTC